MRILPGKYAISTRQATKRVFLIATLFLLSSGGTGYSFAQMSPEDIIREMENLTRGATHTGTYTLHIIRPEWDRTLQFEVWSEGTQRSFIRIQEPPRERGVAFLKVGREMWQFVPRISRVIKIPPSMMMQSWMGSGFTNDDLARESSMVTDYEHELHDIEDVRGFQAYHLTLRTKPDAAVAWARVELRVRTEDYVPLLAEFFNERDQRVRTLTYGDFRPIGGRTVPTRVELVEDRWPDRSTVMITNDARFDLDISDAIFTQTNLRQSR